MWLLWNLFTNQGIDIIRWENPEGDLLVKKFAQNLDQIEDNSSLIVDPGLSAIFVHNGKIEAIQTESGKWSLETDNIPFISSIKNIMSWFETHDKAQVYFVKTNEITNQKWWTPNSITYVDPVYDFPVELRAFGNFTFRVTDVENFWVNYVANRDEVKIDDIRMMITDRLVGFISSILASKKISYNDIDSQAFAISQELMGLTAEEFKRLGLELKDFRIEDTNFTDKTNEFIDKITSKSADVAAINKTAWVQKEALQNYSDIEKLEIMGKAAESGWSAGDMMWAGMGMAMGMNMANEMQRQVWANNTQTSQIQESVEVKLTKLKWLLDKWLISQEDYEKKKWNILDSM